MITPDFAKRFAREWVAAWNEHDLDRVLSHYEDDFEMSSPVIITLLGKASGTLKGKNAIREYWAQALQRLPHLRFEPLQVLVGIEGISLYYKGHRGTVVEVFHFGASGKVCRASAYYAEWPA
jgi:ketosteroid isomerase-like protein